jgi:hypothetical protein
MSYAERIDRLAARAERDRRAFDPPAEPPDEDRAMAYLREGVGPAVALYLEARTGGDPVCFDAAEFDALEEAMNEWLALYAACYGVDLDASFSVRQAAELMVETHNVADVAYLLTKVPPDGETGSGRTTAGTGG